jgi:hypothetical protein
MNCWNSRNKGKTMSKRETANPVTENSVKLQPIADKFSTTTSVAIRTEDLKAVRKLTMDATSLTRLVQIICQALSELYIVPMPSMASAGEMTPTTVIDILDVNTGENYMLICNALVKSALERAGEPLRGRYFSMRVGDIVAGKRYRKCEVIELELVK